MPPRTRKTTDEQAALTEAAASQTPVGVTPDHEHAAAKRQAAMEGVRDADRGMVDALLVERLGYVQRGMNERAEQVTEQLRLRGYRDDE